MDTLIRVQLIESMDWQTVFEEHNEKFPLADRTVEILMRKFA